MIYDPITIHAVSSVIRIGGLRLDLWWWPFIFTLIKNLFVFMDILIFIAMILLIYRFQSFRAKVYEAVEEAMESGRLPKEKMQRKWDLIKEDMDSESAENKKKALSAAIEILDNIFKSANISGDSLEMRIMKIPENQLNFREDIVWAYKLNQSMDADPNLEVDGEEMGRAFYILERALKELNVL